ncbi:protein penguin [Tribolium castaneum]|uniref:Protein penguin-like Protein n=1 Tax=Tribolium castaneum TaxID=7070 RepID=D6WZ15_TRICA|nr:PREDICTED: protein penguin [Tribolium castaneum]EFA09038.1 Protein penguin-like Protein [Tribolium castaneum]|eukprot:XP_971048.1 PREDICTED: protein penguin [Tribolium castaneum]
MAKRKENSESEVVAPKKPKTTKSEVVSKPKFEKKSKYPKQTKAEPKKFVKGAGKVSNEAQKPEDWNEFKKKKKELRLKRRQNKPGFDIIVEAKKMGEKLRCKTLKGGEEERVILINKLHSLLKGKGHYAKFVLAHDTSRIVQWLLKYSSDIVKQQISQELIPVTVDMLQSKYGIFCAKRLLKYGNQATRASMINQMYGHAVKLSSHALSAPVFEYAYSTWASNQQKQHLTQEFFGDMYKKSKDNEIKHLRDVFAQSPDLKTAVLGATKANLGRILDKNLLDSGLVQTVLNQFLCECGDEDRTELISQLIPHIVVISNSKDGSRAAMQCIWHGTNKDRKLAMKTIKEHVIELSKHEHGHCVIITLLDTADDTVLLHKIIIGEILKGARDLAVNEWGRKVLLWLVAPGDPTCFHPVFVKELQEGRQKSNSKKDPQIRRKEILEYSIETLLGLIGEEPEFWLGNSSLAYEMLAIVKSGRGEGLKKALESLVQIIVNPDWTIKANDKEISGVEDAGIHMVLKKLAKNDQNIENCDCTFGSLLINSMSDETLEKWLGLNRGCFLLVAVFENNSALQDTLKTKLMGHKKLLKSQSLAGSKVLLKKLTE